MLRIADDRDNLGDLLLGEFTSSLAHINIALLADDIGESATNTLKRLIKGDSEKINVP